jgi:hypothetical protein
MANNINTTLDFLKSQALRVILKSTTVRYPTIKKKLEEYIKSGGSNFNSLISMVNFNQEVLSSATVSSVYLLAYMDFYALYTVLYANYAVLDNLKEVSRNKYSYIYNIYKELSALISQKEYLQKYSYSTYENFMFSKNIDRLLSGFIVRGGSVSKPLDNNIALTLPVRTSEKFDPAYITCTDIDNSISKSKSSFGKNDLSYELLRLQNNKIGTASGNRAMKMASDNGYTGTPEVTGTIFGYFADNIYVSVTKIEKDSLDNIEAIWLSCSTNGANWSTQYEIMPGIKSEILIEDDLAIGLYITLKDKLSLRVGDRWNIDIINSNIAPPDIDIKIGFDTLNKITTIKFLDTSAYPLTSGISRVKKDKYGEDYIDEYVYSSRIGNIVSPQDRVFEYNISFKQNEFDIYSDQGKVAYKYDFNITSIEAIAETFWPHGSIVLKGEDVVNINTITFTSAEKLPYYGAHTLEVPCVPKTMIEYNIVVEDATSRAIIPAVTNNFIEDNDNLYVWDFVIPKTIDENQGSTTYWGSAYYTPRFQYDLNAGLPSKVYTLFDGVENPGLEYDSIQNIFVITEYVYKQSHILWYPIRVNNIEDIIEISLTDKWIRAGSNIYYMYYKDEDNKIHIAIRSYNINEDILSPFTGKVYGQIEMRSADKPHVTPLVFDCSVSCV